MGARDQIQVFVLAWKVLTDGIAPNSLLLLILDKISVSVKGKNELSDCQVKSKFEAFSCSMIDYLNKVIFPFNIAK